MASSRRSKLALALLVLARVAATALLLGMVHPDEFFQSQEVMARHAIRDHGLRAQLWLPWEFAPASPNRSVLFPALVAGLPYQAMRWLGVEPTGALLLLVPRLLLCGASFAIDAILFAIAKKHNAKNPMRVTLCFASAWPTLVLLTRPFSNTLETLVLALCFATLLLGDPHRRVAGGAFHRQTLLLGALLALGVFARFTFVFFFLPLGVELVRRQDALLAERVAKKATGGGEGVALGRRVAAALWTALQGLLAFAVVAAAVVVVDTLYFRPEMRALQSWRELRLSRVVVAPLNNLRYNLQYEHLALHGVHARSTHAAVNLPLLFGLLHVQLIGSCVAAWRAARRTREPRAAVDSAHSKPTSLLFGAASVFVPLACLSLAPHQEPRFLLPLTVPLHIYAAPSLVATRGRALLWATFNAALAVFFGVLHQGGVVPLLLAFSAGGQPTAQLPLAAWSSLASCEFAPSVQQRVGRVPLVFYKTYMPPRFLLAGLATAPGFEVVDLAGGGDASELAAQLERVQAAGEAFLAAPASVGIERIVTSAFVRSATRVGRCTPHVSTEDLALDKPFALELHLLEMAAVGSGERPSSE
ncbi:hypothetical protein PybrP1_010030 [[Pythium] brassicae (nom. inval.)]|nr:hypothetical protein PybrP1_010030 [[Pythium] brassicae (nom. inval.)]